MIRSCDTGQEIPRFNSCQLTIICTCDIKLLLNTDPPTPFPSFFPQAPTLRKVLHLTLVTLWCRQTDRRLSASVKWIDKHILLPMGLHAHCFTVQISTIIQKNQPLVCKGKFGDSRVLDFDQKTFNSQLEQVNGFKGSGINDRVGYFCQKII